MNKKVIRVLQIGNDNWTNKPELTDQPINWFFTSNECVSDYIYNLLENKNPEFDVILLTDVDTLQDYEMIFKIANPYTILVDKEQLVENSQLITLLDKYKAQKIDIRNMQKVLYDLVKYFFEGQYGDKMDVSSIQISPNFKGQIQYNGHVNLVLKGKFGATLTPTLSWQYNIPADSDYNHELWLEHKTDPSIKLGLSVQMIEQGSSNILKQWLIKDSQMKLPLLIENHANTSYYLALSLQIQGEGTIKIGNLHNRLSRSKFGQFVLGGERFADSNQEEIMSYFYPGDMKPPLNVYFSGYRSAEGFEGYWMMKKLGAPFLLITDPRLEGGAFYCGSDELENHISSTISQKLIELGFTRKELILSGLSMGTFGALYYASIIKPATVIVGKPLVNLGDIATNEKLIRPNIFPTSLDLLLAMEDGTSSDNIERLNQRFWNSFNKANFDDTRFAIAYMENDDYDANAYQNLIEKLSDSKAIVISKGIPGRHNDNSAAINSWFLSQYQRILAENFQRG